MRKLIFIVLCAALVFAAACSAAPQASSPPADASPSAGASVTPSPAAVSAEPAPAEPTPERQYLISASIESECLKGNLANAPTKRNLSIYLPPSYYEGDKAYPVVYYLHGHGEPAGSYVRGSVFDLDNAFEDGADEFIVVGISGGASFYVNSPVSGNWEDYFLTEIIPYIDENYRTIAEAESRGICGFSMGGFGCINIALRHPDIFSAAYSMSPGLLMDDGLPEAMETWGTDSGFLRDYSQAFAPNTEAETLGDVPTLDGTAEDNAIVEKWMTGFGNLEEKMQAYLALSDRLKAIGFSYGTNDAYTWIPKGTQYFSDLLNTNGIENTLYTFSGGHMQPIQSMSKLLIPFFDENLVFEG